MKKRKVGFLKIKGETFPYDILVCLGATHKEILTYIDKQFIVKLTPEEIENIECKKHGRTVRMEGGWYVVILKEFPRTVNDFDYLAHEIFHVADLILRCAGVSLSDDSDEVWAYHIGWITKKIYKEFKLV